MSVKSGCFRAARQKRVFIKNTERKLRFDPKVNSLCAKAVRNTIITLMKWNPEIK